MSIWVYEYMSIWEHKNTSIGAQEYTSVWVHEYMKRRIHEHRGTWEHEYRAHENQSTWVHEYNWLHPGQHDTTMAVNAAAAENGWKAAGTKILFPASFFLLIIPPIYSAATARPVLGQNRPLCNRHWGNCLEDTGRPWAPETPMCGRPKQYLLNIRLFFFDLEHKCWKKVTILKKTY